MNQSLTLKKIQSQNFRNLTDDIFEFSEGINCIFGNNGQGKTNILEAIHLISTGKSFRKKVTFPQLISIDSVKPEIIISAIFSNSKKQIQRTLKITLEKAYYFNNGVLNKKKEKIATILIAPFDAHRFFYESDFKRYWFDFHLGVLNENYAQDLKKYQKHIRNRNKLLSLKPSKFKQQIEAIDQIIADLIKKIVVARIEFIQEINNLCGEAFFEIFSSEHNLNLKYQSKYFLLNKDEIYQKLRTDFEKDLQFGFTKQGPHREHFELFFDGFNSQDFCSLGQQKMAFISLVFAYIELFRYKFTTYPLLLIDDISGELDKARWHKLLKYLSGKKFQILITTANKEFEKEVLELSNTNRIHINSGGIFL